MEQVTKFVSKSGNGAIVYVPSKWMNKKVIVSLADLDIKEEVLHLLKDNLQHVIGVYLYGSYARNEQLEDSDIDLLIVVDKKFDLNPSQFDIHMVEIKSLKDGLKKNPIIFFSIIREAKTLLNQYLLDELKKFEVKDFSWFISTTKSALKISKGLLNLNKEEGAKYANNASIYSIFLRARGLYIIKCIKDNREYTNKGFLNYLINLGFESKFIENAYKVYRAEKVNKLIISDISIKDIYNLCLKLEKEIKKYEKKEKS